MPGHNASMTAGPDEEALEEPLDGPLDEQLFAELRAVARRPAGPPAVPGYRIGEPRGGQGVV